MTVGTNGNISDALDSVGLIPFHDYAILGKVLFFVIE